MLQIEIVQSIEKILSLKYSNDIKISSIKNLAGGSINQVYSLTSGNEKFVLKVNSSQKYPGMFEVEAAGLQLLSEAGTLKIPIVIKAGVARNFSFLLMEYVEAAARVKNFFEDFGTQLANLHRHTATNFGLDHNNYMGSLKQVNKPTQNGIDFFIHQRLMPQLQLAARKNEFHKNEIQQFEKLFLILHDLLPDEEPALIHGDLWSGNFITSSQGKVCLIDPAVSYSFREADIAMSKLFGGFDIDFYSAYHEAFPLQNNWQDRIDIWNLYPLLVHVNLFGGSYRHAVKNILKKYV